MLAGGGSAASNQDRTRPFPAPLFVDGTLRGLPLRVTFSGCSNYLLIPSDVLSKSNGRSKENLIFSLCLPNVSPTKFVCAIWPPGTWECQSCFLELGRRTNQRLVEIRFPFSTCQSYCTGGTTGSVSSCRQLLRHLSRPG